MQEQYQSLKKEYVFAVHFLVKILKVRIANV